jgi:hypothetical protein
VVVAALLLLLLLLLLLPHTYTHVLALLLLQRQRSSSGCCRWPLFLIYPCCRRCCVLLEIRGGGQGKGGWVGPCGDCAEVSKVLFLCQKEAEKRRACNEALWEVQLAQEC